MAGAAATWRQDKRAAIARDLSRDKSAAITRLSKLCEACDCRRMELGAGSCDQYPIVKRDLLQFLGHLVPLEVIGRHLRTIALGFARHLKLCLLALAPACCPGRDTAPSSENSEKSPTAFLRHLRLRSGLLRRPAPPVMEYSS